MLLRRQGLNYPVNVPQNNCLGYTPFQINSIWSVFPVCFQECYYQFLLFSTSEKKLTLFHQMTWRNQGTVHLGTSQPKSLPSSSFLFSFLSVHYIFMISSRDDPSWKALFFLVGKLLRSIDWQSSTRFKENSSNHMVWFYLNNLRQ